MADYRTQFSFVVTTTEEQRNWLKETHRQVLSEEESNLSQSAIVLRSNEYQDPASITIEDSSETGTNTLIFAEKVGNIKYTGDLLQTFLRYFNISNTVSFTWANTCSKMRPEAFSGGSMTVGAWVIINNY